MRVAHKLGVGIDPGEAVVALQGLGADFGLVVSILFPTAGAGPLDNLMLNIPTVQAGLEALSLGFVILCVVADEDHENTAFKIDSP